MREHPVGAQAGKAEPEAKAGPAPTTAWGEPDLQGIWTRDSDEPLQRPAKYADKATFTRRGTRGSRQADRGDRRPRGVGRAPEARHRAGCRRRLQRRRVHVAPAHRPADVDDRRSAGRTDSAADARGAEAATARCGSTALALLQATDVCKNKLPACAGGKYGPPSPRRNETPPSYVCNAASARAAARSTAPTVRKIAATASGAWRRRCRISAAFRRIVQSPRQISIFYDIGQGQGWQRVIPITDAPHVAEERPPVVGRFARPLGRQHAGRRRHEFLARRSNFQGSRENLHLVERWTRLDAETLEYAVTIEDPTMWTQAVDRQAGDERSRTTKANRHLLRAAMSRRELRHAGAAGRAPRRGAAFAAGKGPDPATKCLGGCGGFAGGFADERRRRQSAREVATR